MIGAHVELILILTGILTAGAFVQCLAPATALGMVFRATPGDDATLALARHWGLLVFLVGALLICAAVDPPLRAPVMIAATIEKIALGLGVFGSPLRKRPMAAAIAAGDSLIALIYVLYFAGL